MANLKICEIDDCGKSIEAKGLCQSHNRRRRLYGDPLGGHRFSGGLCAVEDCGRKRHSGGFCTKHYQRVRNNGGPLVLDPRFYQGQKCLGEECQGVAIRLGYCNKHYRTLRRHGDPNTKLVNKEPLFPDRPVTSVCQVTDCERPSHSRAVCHAHYHRFLRRGEIDEKPIKVVVRGQRYVSKQGYVYFIDRSHPEAGKNGSVLEHRAVIAKKIGRSLLPGENVHHINGNRADNDPANLELWVTLQPSGQRPGDLLAYAREIIARYG